MPLTPSLATAHCAEVAWLCGDCSVVTRSIRVDTIQLNKEIVFSRG